MKIEICDNTKIVLIVLVALFSVVTIATVCSNNKLLRDKAAFAAGLEEVNDTAVTTHLGKPHGK